jgi:ketosteroid isomerase-like protein
MKGWVWRAAGALAILALAGWLWTVIFPGPEHVIRKRLAELSKSVSIHGKESPLAVVANASRVADFFTRDIEIRIDVPGAPAQVINGREELFQITQRVRMIVGGLDVQFLDINLTVAPDKNTAEANLTLRAKTAGDRDQIVQEMKLLLNKLEGNWRIQRIETVKTLSRGGDTWPVSNQGVGAVVRI